MAQKILRELLDQRFTDSLGHVLPYRLLAPARTAASGDQAVPLVVLLHGAGERGDDNQAQLRNGAAELLGSEEAAARFPCVYVLPQCPSGNRWVEVDWTLERHTMPAEPSVYLAALLELLTALTRRPDPSYPGPQVSPLARERLRGCTIDPHRLYLIGLSMGGFGVWDLLCRGPRFAAAVPICGGADDTRIGTARAVPIWAFHGAKDPVVRVERSRRAVAALQQAGGHPRYTEYPDVGHDAWSRAFAEPELLPWLFRQRRE